VGKNKIYRAQIKYANRKPSSAENSIILDLRNETRNNGKKKTYSKNEIDVILVYLPVLDKILWVKPELFHNAESLTFRLEEPKNGQKKNIRMAKDYIW